MHFPDHPSLIHFWKQFLSTIMWLIPWKEIPFKELDQNLSYYEFLVEKWTAPLHQFLRLFWSYWFFWNIHFFLSLPHKTKFYSKKITKIFVWNLFCNLHINTQRDTRQKIKTKFMFLKTHPSLYRLEWQNNKTA